MIDSELLLFIEPKEEPSKEPVIDSLTMKMTASFRKGVGGTQEKPLTEDRTNYLNSAYSLERIVRNLKNEKYIFILRNHWRGSHCCSCGVYSDSCNFLLPNLEVTNSLCVHYLAFHRDEISEEQMERVNALEDGEAKPTEDELSSPKKKSLSRSISIGE